MKKLVVISIAIFAIQFSGHAQSTRFGFTAGYSFSNYNSKVDGENNNGNSVAGLTAGVLIDVPINKNFSFQPAVNFVQKGTKDEQTYGGFTTEKTEITVNSIEVPLNFLYNSGGNKGNFFIGAGPSFTFSVSGNVWFEDFLNSVSDNLKFGNGENDDLKGFDFGVNFITGYCFKKGFLISANYNAGLTNLFPGGSDDGKIKSHYFGIKLGYILKGNAKK
jgi:hypothetical protein